MAFNILIVDDTPKNIQVVANILGQNSEYNLSFATDGEMALEVVKSTDFDLILLDVMMPKLDGFGACEKLKSNEATKDIPVIFLTAKIEPESISRGFEIGGVDYITKPFNSDELIARVKTHIKLKKSMSELKEINKNLKVISNKLSKYLSPQLYSAIFSGKQSIDVISKRKKLTIFFSDIVNFTQTTSHLEAEDMTDLLNYYFTEMSKIAIEYGGTIDKYIGDAILIFFGDPESKGVKEDATSCVSMAVKMRERVKQMQKELYEKGVSEPFKVRMGINTGYATVGNFGSSEKLEYTIIGNEVNLASRLEHYSQIDDILISHETYSLIKEVFKCEKSEEITVKGIYKSIQTYKVIDFIENIQENQSLSSGFNGLNLDNLSEKQRQKVLEELKSMVSKLEGS